MNFGTWGQPGHNQRRCTKKVLTAEERILESGSDYKGKDTGGKDEESDDEEEEEDPQPADDQKIDEDEHYSGALAELAVNADEVEGVNQEASFEPFIGLDYE